MNLITFVRLIHTNLKWLLGVPLFFAFLVIYFTKDMPKGYKSNTIIYTGIASGYDITTGENSKVDYFAVNTAFDNIINIIKSRETQEEVAIQLLAQHLMQKHPQINVLGVEGFKMLRDNFPDSLRQIFVAPDNFEMTVRNITSFKNATVKNEISELLAGSSGFYGINQIGSKLGVRRKNSSDLIEIEFTSTDPAVAQHTLKFLAATFMKRYKGLKGLETSSVVDYFNTQLNNAYNRLQDSEEKLKNFGIDNRIINYPEQSKFIAEAKEDLEAELYGQKMKNAAAKAALERLETQMSDVLVQLQNNQDLSRAREKLSNINILISNGEVYNESTATLDSLYRERYQAQESIRDIVETHYNYNHTIEGIETNKLLDQWLKKIIEFEETKANLEVFKQRKQEFDELYDQYAPLGTTLGKLEREVGISEKQYLSLLHGLNMAQLRQQNVEMSNTISVLDAPFFPVNSQSSKRKVLIVISFIGVFILILTIIILKEFLDDSVKTRERAEKITGLEVAGAIPNKEIRDKHISTKYVNNALLSQLISNINLSINKHKESNKQFFAIIYSIRPNEGKSYFAEKLAKKMIEVNGNVIYLRPQLPNKTQYTPEFYSDNLLYHEYEISDKFINERDWKNLIPDDLLASFESNHVFLELPPINRYSMPAGIIAQADFSLLLINANRVWRAVDNSINQRYLKASNGNILVVLNKIHSYYLESFLGDVPKGRSKIRNWIKKAILFNFRKH